MARPKANIDPAVVEAMAGIGCTTKEIAGVVGVSADTLERRFAALLKKGRATFKISLRREQWKHAQKGNAALLIFLGKNHLGQKNYEVVEHSGSIKTSAREKLASAIARIASRKRTEEPAAQADGEGSGELTP